MPGIKRNMFPLFHLSLLAAEKPDLPQHICNLIMGL